MYLAQESPSSYPNLAANLLVSICSSCQVSYVNPISFENKIASSHMAEFICLNGSYIAKAHVDVLGPSRLR